MKNDVKKIIKESGLEAELIDKINVLKKTAKSFMNEIDTGYHTLVVAELMEFCANQLEVIYNRNEVDELFLTFYLNVSKMILGGPDFFNQVNSKLSDIVIEKDKINSLLKP